MQSEVQSIRKELRRSAEARFLHRLHGVLLVSNGLSTVETGKLLGVPQRTVSRWVIEFKRGGIDALRDRIKSGRPTALNPKQQTFLSSALKRSPRAFGLGGEVWTGALISTLLRQRYGVELTIRHCRRLMKSVELGNTSRGPNKRQKSE